MNIEPADLMLSSVESGEVRVNIGDKVDGAGFGASIGYWGVDGFLSRPNPTNADGAAQALYLTHGNTRRVLASRDNRFVGPFGAPGEGDRMIVSNCDAGLWLDRAGNSIRIQAGTGLEVVVDGDAGTVTVSKGGVSATFADAALTLVFNPALAPTPPTSIVLNAAGVAITGLAVTVNGIPVP